MVLRGYRSVAVAVAAVLTLSAAGCSSHSAARATRAAPDRVADCGGAPQVRPDIVVVRCADRSMVAMRLKWSGWGTPVATASGPAIINTCEFIDCHTGAYAQYHVVLVLSGMRRCPKGGPAYARIQYMFVGHFDAWPVSAVNQIVPRPCGSVPPGPAQEASIPPSVLR